MKSNNLFQKGTGNQWHEPNIETLMPPLFCYSTMGRFFPAHGVMQWVIILLSGNLVPLLPTGVLGSSAANKEHISREEEKTR